ncbi:uncharacterized protein LOC135116963 [Helicoverpa armigera]|uniref:uncharacterized protein LOC135116963 n=1 Tax=Helicoverpa armigera TaxID=29058 RepID=UPI0030836078
MPRTVRTPPKESSASNITQASSEPNIPAAAPESSNVCVRQKRPRMDGSPEPEFQCPKTELIDCIRQEIRSVLSLEISANIKKSITIELGDIKSLFNDLKQSVDFMSEEFDRMKAELETCRNGNKILHKENDSLRHTISELSSRVNLIEQHARQQNLEINGIPESKAENLVKTVQQIGNVISCSIKDDDILSVVRVRKLDPESSNPRAVVVKLRSMLLRDTILTSVMNYNKAHPDKKLNSQHLGYANSIKPVFVSEHLSPLNKKIHAAARKVAKEKGYKYVWVRDGKILIRKDDGQQAKQIKSLEAVSLL